MFVYMFFVSLIFTSLTYDMRTLQGIFNRHFCKCSESICVNNFQNIADDSKLHFTNESIWKNELGIDEIDLSNGSFTSSYIFPNSKRNGEIMSSALFSIPKMPQGKIKGVVLYFHPTLFDKREVPSQMGEEYKAIAALYGSFGYAVVFPNYLGFESEDKVHPYVLYPQQNVQTGIAAVNYFLSKHKISGSIRLVTVGYSEGGAYAIWSNKCIENKSNCPFINPTVKLDSAFYFTDSSGLEGAYDLVNVVLPFLKEEVSERGANKFEIESQTITNVVKPSLTILTLFGFNYYSGIINPFNVYFNQEFYDMKCSKPLLPELCYVNGRNINIEALLLKEDVSVFEFIEPVGASASYKVMNEKTYSPKGSQNSVEALVRAGTFSIIKFQESLANASLIGFRGSGIHVFSLERDSVVSPLNARYFIGNNTSTVFDFLKNERYKVCPIGYEVNVDHIEGELVANVFSLAYFNRKNSKENNIWRIQKKRKYDD